MAIYHFTTKIIKASAGKNAVASAAYQAGQSLYSDRTGQTFSYTHKEEVMHTGILLPENAPERLRDRATLWNEVELVQKKRTADMPEPLSSLFRMNGMKRKRKPIPKHFCKGFRFTRNGG